MVDLVKIRKKAKKAVEEQRNQGVEEKPAEAPRSEAAPQPALKSAAVPEAQPTQLPTPSTQQSEPSDSSKLEKFKSHAGEKREGFVSEAEQVVSTGDQLELLTFTLAHEQYAVEIEHIVEIVPPRAITRIPNADASVVGIMSLRGTIVTVVDVRQRLRHPVVSEEHPDRRIIVVEHGGETLGFEVDRVLRVVKTDPAAIEPHPVVHASELHEAIRGVFRPADALTILLDFDKLLA